MKKFNSFLFVTVLTMLTTVAFAQSTLTGKVIDGEMNAPLPGANVIVKGTSNGATTDFDGNFTITAASDSGEIVISYVGFETKVVAFNGDTDFGSIVLNLDNTLDEVVVVGSGIIDLAEDRKTPVAVSTIKGKDIVLKATGNVEFGEAMKNTPSIYVSNQDL